MKFGYKGRKMNQKTNQLETVIGVIDVPAATETLSISSILEGMGLIGPFELWLV